MLFGIGPKATENNINTAKRLINSIKQKKSSKVGTVEHDVNRNLFHTISLVNEFETDLGYWNNFINAYDLNNGKSIISKNIYENGLPSSLRGAVWLHMVGAKQCWFNHSDYKCSYYQQLLTKFKQVSDKKDKSSKEKPNVNYNDGSNKSNMKHDIWYNPLLLDCKRMVNRYGRNNLNEEFQSKLESLNLIAVTSRECESLQDKIHNILIAFALHNEKVGYRGGMCFVAEFLLTQMNEEEVFWFLIALTNENKNNKYKMHLSWGKESSDIQLLYYQAEMLVTKLLPKLVKRFKQVHKMEDFVSVMNVGQWFILVFIGFDSINFNILLRIWDVYINIGIRAMFQFGIAFLKYHEKKLLSANFEESLNLFQYGWKNVDMKKYFDICSTVKITDKELDQLEQKFKQINN